MQQTWVNPLLLFLCLSHLVAAAAVAIKSEAGAACGGHNAAAHLPHSTVYETKSINRLCRLNLALMHKYQHIGQDAPMHTWHSSTSILTNFTLGY